jgi:hypothetical protein
MYTAINIYALSVWYIVTDLSYVYASDVHAGVCVCVWKREREREHQSVRKLFTEW